jgi:hypothetical protein
MGGPSPSSRCAVRAVSAPERHSVVRWCFQRRAIARPQARARTIDIGRVLLGTAPIGWTPNRSEQRPDRGRGSVHRPTVPDFANARKGSLAASPDCCRASPASFDVNGAAPPSFWTFSGRRTLQPADSSVRRPSIRRARVAHREHGEPNSSLGSAPAGRALPRAAARGGSLRETLVRRGVRHARKTQNPFARRAGA